MREREERLVRDHRLVPAEPSEQRADRPVPSPTPLPGGLARAVLHGAGNGAVLRYLQSTGALSTPGDALERDADRRSRSALAATSSDGVVQAAEPVAPRHVQRAPGAPDAVALDAGVASLGQGRPLAPAVRSFMEPRFGTPFTDVRVHTDRAAAAANAALHARAFTYGRDIFFGAGRTPANDSLTAHELSHVMQQRRGGALAARRIQASFTGSFPVSLGVFEVDLQTREGAVATPPAHSGLDGYIRFVPAIGSPNSSQIVMVQIVKLTNVGGSDVNPGSMPAAQAPRGALGDPGVRTADDAARGIEGGFFTDVHHRPTASAPGQPQGAALSPRYNFQPASAGTTGHGQTAQLPEYGGGVGGVVGQTPGFKRSDDVADIRSAALYDTPGVASNALDLDFAFETVVRGEDTMIVYGVVRWGFGLRSGRVVNEYLTPGDWASATFGETLERHRDFYVHEPVTFYFDVDADALPAAESAKIDTFLAYLDRNPTVRMSIEGFADTAGGPSDHNLDLSLRRAEAVRAALVAKGVDGGRIDDVLVGFGASTDATLDAGTGDQGGDAAVGADQEREANRWANRRAVLTFAQTASTPVGGGP